MLLLVLSALVAQAQCSFPPLWDEAVLLSDLPRTSTGAAILDPWNYTQRLGSLKSLISLTTAASPCLFPSVADNVLWGLALQHGWQYSSGRLFVNASEPTRLTPRSWWADMNYQLSIIPLLGAQASGLEGVPELHVLPPPQNQNQATSAFCLSATAASPACDAARESLQNWTAYFVTLKKAEGNCTRDGRTRAHDWVMAAMWGAHVTSLKKGLSLFGPEVDALAVPEKNFGLGWSSLVEFIGDVHFVTDFNGTTKQQEYLPARMLRPGDVPGSVPDFPKLTNRCVALLETLSAANKASGGSLLNSWKRAMCSEKGRQEGRKLFNNLIEKPLIIVPAMLSLIADVATQPCDPY